jgi:hypothetical protein
MVFKIILPQPMSKKTANKGKHEKKIQHAQKCTKKDTKSKNKSLIYYTGKIESITETHRYIIGNSCVLLMFYVPLTVQPYCEQLAILDSCLLQLQAFAFADRPPPYPLTLMSSTVYCILPAATHAHKTQLKKKHAAMAGILEMVSRPHRDRATSTAYAGSVAASVPFLS